MINKVSFLYTIEDTLSIVTALLLGISALMLTYVYRGLQVRSFKRFWHILRHPISAQKHKPGTMSALHALYTAMSTSLGIGTIVGPSIAITLGGPGALLWLVLYAALGSILKFSEVLFALSFRTYSKDGTLIGGPVHYLKEITPHLATWYALSTVVLFASWSSVQTNVLAHTLSRHAIPPLVTGIGYGLLVVIMLLGGAQKIGSFNSMLVPVMSMLYISSSVYILILNYQSIIPIVHDIFYFSIHPIPAVSGIITSTVLYTMQAGIFKGVYITESGMGTASIAHSMAHTDKPSDQATLAMVSVFADTALCALSGFLVLTSSEWQHGCISNGLLYSVFETNMPHIGTFVLSFTIVLFATGTIIGNSFNGLHSFYYVSHKRYELWYIALVCCAIICGAIITTPTMWKIIDLLLPLVAIPNVLSLLYLTLRKQHMHIITKL